MVSVVCALMGCGSSADDPQAPSDEPADLKAINGAVSDYLSAIIDTPAAVRDKNVARSTVADLEDVAAQAPQACANVVRGVERIIERVDLSAQAKRKRVLDAMVPVYGECAE